jgi:hypothetical protein
MGRYTCCICEKEVADADSSISELIGGNALIWIAHEKCLPPCPRCRHPLDPGNCHLRKSRPGLFGYVPEHRHCPIFTALGDSTKAA